MEKIQTNWTWKEINFLNFWDAQTAMYCTVMERLYLDKRQRPRTKNTSAAKLIPEVGREN